MNRLLLAALLAVAGVGVSAADQTVPAGVPTEASGAVSKDAEQPHAQARVCYGGLEDGKVVVRVGRLGDEAGQTTVERCRVGGGATGRMPRSPTIAAGRPAFA